MRKIVLLPLLLSITSTFLFASISDSAMYYNYPAENFAKVVAIDGKGITGNERKETTTPTKPISKPQPSYETMTMRITAYTPSPDEGYHITKTGINLWESHEPIVAVDPNIIPLHSVVEINGVQYHAEDTGSAIKGHRIDMLVNTKHQASEWGVQHIEVKVYKPNKG